MIFCIESNHQDYLAGVLELLKDVLLKNGIRARFLSFPSDGPFGHQIRVVETGRYELDTIPDHMLRMVDRMDTFLNPHNGLNHILEEFDCLIMSESQYKEALMTADADLSEWILEINNNIPKTDKIFWLSEHNEKKSKSPRLPLIEVVEFTSKSTISMTHTLAKKIIAEVKND